jgi:hypothetical protein
MKNFKSFITEGRPSQQHPLEGHDYHQKTDAQLEYIAKDAHKAAEAMKGHNTTAENKYRDQANDSATVRYWRKKHGMPDWYKKKYGHIKEEVEQVDEISKELANRYMYSAITDRNKIDDKRVKLSAKNSQQMRYRGSISLRRHKNITNLLDKSNKRTTGISRALNRITKEEVEQIDEDWQKVNKADKTDGLSQKAVDAYRRENPGSKLKTAVTEKNPKGKRAARRKSFCSRMGGMKKRLTNPENARDPDSPINKALRRWNC